MARPLRIEIEGERYHQTARQNERRAIYRDNRDREQFLELLAEFPGRFGSILDAYVLMNNHYHLVIQTPEANLSRIGQWPNATARADKTGRAGTGCLRDGLRGGEGGGESVRAKTQG